jgi:DNA-binding IclR family transcriptional regulator
MSTLPQKLVPALHSAIRILRYLNHSGEPAGVAQISQALGINPSTCFNLLKTLAHERLLVFDATSKRYGLGLGLVELAHGVLNAGYVPFIHPHLEAIATRFNVTALLWQDAGQNRFVLVDKAESNGAIRVHLTIGQRFPALIGAFGRCVAAQSQIGKEELRARFSELRWQEPPDFEDYWKDVQKARKEGYAVDHGNFNAGMTTVAAVIADQSNTPVMAISTIALSSQLAEINLDDLAHAVKSVAREVGTAMDGGRAADVGPG